MPIPKTKELLEPVIAELKSISERLDKIEAKLVKPEEKPVYIAKVEAVSVSTTASAPVPSEYREVVYSMLNSRFGISIEPESNSPTFRFTIHVPKEYSSLGDGEFKESGGDRRPVMLTYADGVPGVRMWVEKVWNNFNPEVKAKIKSDQQQDG